MVESTHDVVVDGDRVTKSYRRWERDEPRREHAALRLLHRHAPGLAPEPLELREDPPVLVMSRLEGRSLGAERLTPRQVGALAEGLLRLHRAVPPDELEVLGERRYGPVEMLRSVRRWANASGQPDTAAGPALGEARRWLHGAEAAVLDGPLPERVFGLADGNIGNVLWDGERCRFVDFEDAGASDPAYEVADLLEHVTVWLPALVEPDRLLDALGLSGAQLERLERYRTLLSIFWLLMLLPGSPGHSRNPPGSLERQAGRVLALTREW